MARKDVNAPLKPEDRDRDINHKLQLYGIYSAFASGKVPSNKQIDVALNSLLDSKALSKPSEDLSDETYQIIDDVRDVIASARNLVLVKNQDNLLQEFIWDAERFQRPQSTTEGGPRFSKDAEKQRAAKAAEGLKTLGTLLVTNGQFRKLLTDTGILLRDMASDSAQRAANVIRPSQEQMEQLDQPAAEGVWHDKPDVNKDSIRARFGRKKGKAAEAAQGTTNGAGGQTAATTNGVGASTATNGVDGATTERTDGVNGTQKEKKRGKEVADKTRAFLAEKVPRERREQTVWRLKKMIVEVQGHSDYQQAIESLLTLAEEYGHRWRDASKSETERFKGIREDSEIGNLETKLRTLIERFANCTSMEDLMDSLKTISKDADNDARLRDWFRNVNGYIRRCLREQGFVLEDSATEEWRKLYDEGRYLFRERYRDHANRVVGELKFIGEQFDQDPQNRNLRRSLEKFFHDLGYDANGKLAFKRHLLKDSTNSILPGIFTHLRYVPIPRIEVSDPMIDVVIENLAVETDNLMPNVLEFGNDNYFRWGRKNIGNKRDNKIMISATGIQTDWRDVSYYIKKKQGFPRISDQGVMDIFMGGDGFSFRVIASSSKDPDKLHFVKPEKITVNIKNLDIRLKKSKHKLLFGLFKPMLFSVVRPAIHKILEKQVREMFLKADAFAHEVDAEATRTRELARNDPEEARNLYAHYAAAVRKQIMEQKKRAEEVAAGKVKRDTKLHFAMTAEDYIFKDIKLPGAISTKATEYKEIAAKGDRWESPVFSIGKAGETKDLPSLPSIQRKPHKIDVGTGSRGDEGYGGETGGPSRYGGETNGTKGYGGGGGTYGGFQDNLHGQKVDGRTGGYGGIHDDTQHGQKVDSMAGAFPTIPGTGAPI